VTAQCAAHRTSGIACEDRQPPCGVVRITSVPETRKLEQALETVWQAKQPVAVAEAEGLAPIPSTASGEPEQAPRLKPIKWFDGLFGHPELTVYDVAVGAYLFRRAGKSMDCWPKQSDIAKACHIGRDTVIAALGRLTKLGMIDAKRRRRSDGTKFTSTSNKYRLLPPEQWVSNVGPTDIPSLEAMSG